MQKGSENMNRIFKVIWSKTKNCYVVASELAKGRTKAASTGDKAKRLALAAITALMLLPVGGFSYAADSITIGTVELKDTSGNEKVLTVTQGDASTIGTTLSQVSTNQNDIATLQKQVSTNKNDIAEKANATDVYTKTETDQKVDAANKYTYRKVAAEEKARKAADTELNERITNEANAIHDEIKAGDKALDDRITNVKEYLEKQTSDNYVSKADAAVQDGAIVKAANTIGDNVTKLDAALAKETAARIGADKAQDAVIQQVNQNAANGIATLATAYNNEVASREAADNELNERITNEANAIHETTNQLQSHLSEEAKTRESKDNELNERITNEANAIHDEIKAGDEKLDTRITNVKEYLEKQTSDTYVSKDDAAVQDGAIVKADKTIGENVTNLDAALAKETAARLGADKAQDKVIETVNQNMVDGFNTINKNMADGFTALNQADANEAAAREAADTTLQTNIDNEAAERKAADTVLDDKITAETSARVAADTKLVEAVNSGLSLSNDNVLQKNTTTIDAQGNVTTSKTDANEMILNKGKDNQITLNKNGIKVGTNSTVVDKDGVYTGGDTYAAAKAAMSADGKIKGANGAFTVDENGNVASKATITGETVTDGKGASMSNGTVTGKTLTDGIATITNGNINTSSTITGGTVTSTGNISALGDIHAGGAITGASASIQGALTAGSATITGDLTAGGAIQGKSLSDGTATMQNGNLTGVKNLSAETITTSGDATIGGDLTVNGKLNVDEIDLTKSGIVGDNNVTASTKVAAGEITSYKKATSTKDGSEKEAAFDYDENGTSTWAKATDADGNWKKSTLTVKGSDVTSKVVDSDKNSNESKQTSTESSDVVKDADGNTSTFSQRVKDILQEIKNASGDTLTKVEQTDTAITSQIGDGSAVKSEMTADGITNTAVGRTITNSAKDLVNTATGDMTNTVGGKMLNDVTGDMENKVGGNLTTMVGGNETHTVGGTLTETVTGKATENYNGGLETTITGEEKHTVNGDQTNTITGKQTTTVIGDVREDYKANLSTTVGGNQTTTVTGDSSLTAENITNEAKNKITNKALDVETDASSSIVSKVSNEYGSNTSTQLSYQTTEEMSQADGKKASYLRGAAEEKSQLTDGDKKTTIDTIAGQTNTNITDGTNTSNNLQKADQVASSVTDGTNTTVVNQDVRSIASSITDGTKSNTMSNTVDGSAQQIKASDTQYSATSKTATKTEEALVNGSTILDVVKDSGTGTISAAVTDGTNTTGSTMTASGITNTTSGDISNSAANISNTTTGNMTNTVGGNLIDTIMGTSTTTVTGKVTEDYKSDLSTKVGGDETHAVTGNQTTTVSGNRTVNVKGTETENFNALETNVKTDQKTSVGGNQTTIVTGNQTNNVSGSKTETVKGSVTEKYGSQATTVDGDQSTNIGGNQTTVVAKDQINTVSGNKTETVKGAVNETYGSQTTKVNGDQSTTVTGKQTNSITGDQVNTIGGSQTTTVTGDSSLSAKNITNTASEKITNQIGDGSAVKSEMTADGITNTAEGGTIYNKSKDILNEASGDILNFADGEIGNSATKITNLTGDNTVTSDTNGTTFENKAHSTAVKEGTVTKTTISGNTITTGEAVMDYADVMKDLGVRGNAAVDGNTTLGKEGAETTLTVNSTSTFNKDVTMKENATVAKDLSVGGNASVSGSVTAFSYKVGDKTYISESGINANDQKVVNVAPGRIAADSKDAINGSQLYQTNERVTSVENRVGTVENRVDKLDSRVDKVGANAAALANLHPLEFDADSKWNIAAAVGGYKGETATAIGAFYRPNENVMVNVSSSFGTGENMYGGGISLRIGQGGNKARRNATNGLTEREKAMQKQIDSLTSRLDALLSVINPNMSKDFPDVPENHWAYEAVSRLAGNGVIQGYEDGKYHGDRTMTRYEMAEIIYNALSKGAKAEKKLVEEFKPELQAMAAQKKA